MKGLQHDLLIAKGWKPIHRVLMYSKRFIDGNITWRKLYVCSGSQHRANMSSTVKSIFTACLKTKQYFLFLFSLKQNKLHAVTFLKNTKTNQPSFCFAKILHPWHSPGSLECCISKVYDHYEGTLHLWWSEGRNTELSQCTDCSKFESLVVSRRFYRNLSPFHSSLPWSHWKQTYGIYFEKDFTFKVNHKLTSNLKSSSVG